MSAQKKLAKFQTAVSNSNQTAQFLVSESSSSASISRLDEHLEARIPGLARDKLKVYIAGLKDAANIVTVQDFERLTEAELRDEYNLFKVKTYIYFLWVQFYWLEF